MLAIGCPRIPPLDDLRYEIGVGAWRPGQIDADVLVAVMVVIAIVVVIIVVVVVVVVVPHFEGGTQIAGLSLRRYCTGSYGVTPNAPQPCLEIGVCGSANPCVAPKLQMQMR